MYFLWVSLINIHNAFPSYVLGLYTRVNITLMPLTNEIYLDTQSSILHKEPYMQKVSKTFFLRHVLVYLEIGGIKLQKPEVFREIRHELLEF